MKKLLAMFLVLGMATVANAAVLEIVRSDIGSSGGRLGLTNADELQLGDIIQIDIVIGHTTYPDPLFSSYDGYLISSVDVGLITTGNGSLSYLLDKSGDPAVGTDLDSIVIDAATSGDLPRFQGISLAGISGRDNEVIATGLRYEMTGLNDVGLALSLIGLTEYSVYQKALGGPYPGGWTAAVLADLDSTTIHQVIPEPITMSLLGLGGLALIRRRRKA